jgi:hypothetical protein
VLAEDVPDQLLHQVFQRDDPGDATLFVDHDSEG